MISYKIDRETKIRLLNALKRSSFIQDDANHLLRLLNRSDDVLNLDNLSTPELKIFHDLQMKVYEQTK